MLGDGSAVDPAALQAHLRSDPHLVQQLRQGNPELHAAVGTLRYTLRALNPKISKP